MVISKAKRNGGRIPSCLIDGCLNFVCVSAFAPCCPSGSGVLQNIKNTTTAIIRIRIIEPIILKSFFHYVKSFCLISYSKVLKTISKECFIICYEQQRV
jgi:hypothetical protein